MNLMPPYFVQVISTFLLIAVLSSAGAAERKALVNVAVMNLKAEEGTTESVANLMSDILRTELYDTGRFKVMNREDMDAILQEVAFQQSGACDETSCIVEIGQALGVRKMVAGSLGVINDQYILNLKLINVESMESEVLVTKYHPVTSKKGLQALFQTAARALAEKGGGKGRVRSPGYGVAGSFALVARMGYGFGPAATNHTPQTLSATAGSISVTSTLTATTGRTVPAALALGLRYFPTGWLQLELNYRPMNWQGEFNYVLETTANIGCTNCKYGETLTINSNGGEFSASWVRPLGKKLRMSAGLGYWMAFFKFDQEKKRFVDINLDFFSGPDSVNLSYFAGMRNGSKHHGDMGIGRLFIRLGTEWRPQKRLGLGIVVDGLVGSADLVTEANITKTENGVDTQVYQDFVTFKLPRVVAHTELTVYF